MLHSPPRTAIAAALLAFALTPALAQPVPHPTRTPVLVELFTSEGCSSCPPADALLAHLLKAQPVPSADILVLEEHVDYWDQLGWHDRFSSHEVTARQSRYVQRFGLDDDYTPQMIVDGADQFTGNDAAHALRAITAASRTAKPALTLSPIAFDANRLNGTVSISASPTPLPKADLIAAVIQTVASTQVQRGENGGRTLNHVSVLRSLQRIGTPADAAAAPLRFSIPAPTVASAASLRVIVFIQRSGQGPILGAISSDPLRAAAVATSVAAGQPHPKR